MSRKASSRVNSTPEMIHEKPAMPLKHKVTGNRKRSVGIFTFRLHKSSGFSAVKFFRRLRSKVAKALCMVSMTQRKRTACSSTSNTTSSSSNMMRNRSRSYVAPTDSHRSEAIEDCIEFINSSSSFQRSNSVCVSSSSSSSLVAAF